MAQVVELILTGTEAGFDVGQTIPISQLTKGHAEKLVPAGEGFDLVVSGIEMDAPLKALGVDMVHKLGEYVFLGKHFRGVARKVLGEKPEKWANSIQIAHSPRTDLEAHEH